MKFPALFALIVGLTMVAQWSVSILSGGVPEITDEPVRIGFHIAAEFVTAGALVVAGFALLRGRRWGKPVYLVAVGMLFYTAIVSPGYFAQRGSWFWVPIFAAIIAGGVIGLIPVLKRAET